MLKCPKRCGAATSDFGADTRLSVEDKDYQPPFPLRAS